MKLALSNFAFDKEDEDKLFPFLIENGVSGVEVVLNKIRNWGELNQDYVKDYKNKLDDCGLKCVGLQSIFYGSSIKDLNDTRGVIDHLHYVIEYASILGAEVLVLGSPTLRKNFNIFNMGVILWEIKHQLKDTNIKLLLEPNAKFYNGEYWFSVQEILQFFHQIKIRNNVGTMIDTHNIKLEGEDPNNVITDYIDWIDHIHVSEVHLQSLDFLHNHNVFAGTLNKMNYSKNITYEVTKNSNNLLDSIKVFSEIYSIAFRKDIVLQ